MSEWKEIAENALDTLERKIQLSDHYDLISTCPSDNDEQKSVNFIMTEYETGITLHLSASIEEGDIIKTKDKENETMEKNYKTIKEDFGYMPLAGYIAELNQKICSFDGFNVIEFLLRLKDTTQLMEDGELEKEMFIILSYDIDSSMELQFDIVANLDDSTMEFDYDKHYYRIYTDGDDWGLDTIEPIEETYHLVEVEVTRKRIIEEKATVRVLVADSFGDDPTEEAEYYIRDHYDETDNLEWETDDEDGELEDFEVIGATREDTDTKENLEADYDVDEVLD